jgi:hypothetical protein
MALTQPTAASSTVRAFVRRLLDAEEKLVEQGVDPRSPEGQERLLAAVSHRSPEELAADVSPRLVRSLRNLWADGGLSIEMLANSSRLDPDVVRAIVGPPRNTR